MNIYVFDKSFKLLGVIDNYSSLIWIREYYNIGTLELHTLINELTLSLLQKGNILVKEDNLEEAMYIDSIYMDYETSETMTVRGYSIDNFLDDRFVWGIQTYEGTAETVLREFVNKNAITPTNPNRIIPGLVLGPIHGITDAATETNANSKLSEVMKELSLKYDVGWRIRFDREGRKYVFEVYRGLDSSIGQTANPHKIFSSEYENIFNQSYTDSDSSYKTMAFVAGTGEDPDRLTIAINDELTGFARKELFVDAKDISDKDDDNNPISAEQYIQLLKERGLSKLAEFSTIRTFESEVSILSNLAYRKDFDLGDKVTVSNDKWGLVISTRITSVEEIYENNVTSIRVNFGSIIPTIADKINKAVK